MDYVYIPWRSIEGDYREIIYTLYPNIESTFRECTEFELVLHLFCQFYLPPCGNSTHFEPPATVCPSACRVPSLVCPDEWDKIVNLYEVNAAFIDTENFYFINCSDTGQHLRPVPHCCHNAGINTSKLL